MYFTQSWRRTQVFLWRPCAKPFFSRNAFVPQKSLQRGVKVYKAVLYFFYGGDLKIHYKPGCRSAVFFVSGSIAKLFGVRSGLKVAIVPLKI